MKYSKKNTFDYENGFILTSDVYRLGNILSHYELYKKIVDLPGDVLELGVFKGNSFIQFCTFRELLENERSRKIVGFDAFGEFPNGGGGRSAMPVLYTNGTDSSATSFCLTKTSRSVCVAKASEILN